VFAFWTYVSSFDYSVIKVVHSSDGNGREWKCCKPFPHKYSTTGKKTARDWAYTTHRLFEILARFVCADCHGYAPIDPGISRRCSTSNRIDVFRRRRTGGKLTHASDDRWTRTQPQCWSVKRKPSYVHRQTWPPLTQTVI